MPFNTILVHVDATPGAGDRVKAAADFARRHGAALIGLTAAMPRASLDAYVVGVGGVGSDLVAADRAEIEFDFTACESLFREATAGRGLATEWRAVEQVPAAALVEAANAADLLVVGQTGQQNADEYRTLDAGELLVRSGRPLLVVPPGHREVNVRSAMVAWKNTREARRAIADALPALARAERVVLLTIGEGKDPDPTVGDAEAYLLRHGIHARVECAPRKAASVEETIIRFAKTTQADLIVAGAYGHTRLREWVFGGVTRQLLESSPVACMLSH